MEREREKLCKANGVGAATGILRVNEWELFFLINFY
jgi:hypothetical protein